MHHHSHQMKLINESTRVYQHQGAQDILKFYFRTKKREEVFMLLSHEMFEFALDLKLRHRRHSTEYAIQLIVHYYQ